MGVTRRELLLAAGVGIGGLAASAAGAASASALINAPVSSRNAPVYRSSGGRLRVDLTAGTEAVKVNGVATRGLQTYNGRFPAPTLIVKPGDRL
jgi:FtsP/CotA-like multicopper oxidase with cupredoxin domain